MFQQRHLASKRVSARLTELGNRGLRVARVLIEDPGNGWRRTWRPPSLSAIPYEVFYRLGLYRLAWHRDDAIEELVRWHLAGKFPGREALEVGAGAASNALYLARHGFDAMAIDFAPRAVAIAERRARELALSLRTGVLDLTAQQPKIGSFGVIIDRECLQDLSSAALREAYARNIMSWLGPGGALVIATWVYLDETDRRRRFPTARLSAAEISRLFPQLVIEEEQIQQRLLYGFHSSHATYLLRRPA